MLTWTNPTIGIGWIVALVVAILAVLLFALGRLDLPWCLAIVAVCSVRL